MRLRSHLLLLVLAGLLPVALFAIVTGYLLVNEQRDTFRRGAEERTLALLTAVDAELRGVAGTIMVLSQTESLARGDLALFRATAQRVLAAQPDWNTINLALPTGERVLDLLVPEGEPLPPIQRTETSFERVLQTRKPVIGDLAIGPSSKRWDYAVRTVVMEGDAVKYVLSAVVSPRSIARLVEEQNLPPGWVGVVVDANDRIVARTLAPETTTGQFASQTLRDALASAPSGWFRGTTIEAADVYTPYRRSDESGWAFAMGIPADVVDATAWRAYGVFGVGLLGALVLACAFAAIVGRRISGPIAALSAATEAVRRGEHAEVPQTASVTEVRHFARVLQDCLDTVHEREERLQRALADREKAEQALREADRHKDDFLATLSHELRNPLGALATAFHVLKTTAPDGQRIAAMHGVIDRQMQHMVRLIEDLLDMTRIRLGKLTLKKVPMDLGAFVSDVTQAKRMAGALEGRAPVYVDTTPVWIEGDPARLEQVYSNMLGNAHKFTPVNGAVHVSVARDGERAVLSVRDNGQGIPADTLPRVFDLFSQGDQTMGGAQGGLGLGLALVRRLVELHDGVVVAESAGAGAGATFTVSLPAIESPMA